MCSEHKLATGTSLRCSLLHVLIQAWLLLCANPNCWEASYTAARCCSGIVGQGDLACWSGVATFAACCELGGSLIDDELPVVDPPRLLLQRCAQGARKTCCNAAAAGRFFLEPVYRSRTNHEDFVDQQCANQAPIYGLVFALLGALHGRHLIEIGGGSGRWAAEFTRRSFDVSLLDLPGLNLREATEWLREQESAGAAGRWETIGWDVDERPMPNLTMLREGIGCSVVAAIEVIEHLQRPHQLLQPLRDLLLSRKVQAAVLSTPDRDSWYDRRYHRGPPHNPAHVREWNATEIVRFLSCEGLVPAVLLRVDGSLVALLGSAVVLADVVNGAVWDSVASQSFRDAVMYLALPPPLAWSVPLWQRLF